MPTRDAPSRPLGFSLLEVVVVVAIVGVISAIAIPRLAGAVENARFRSLKMNQTTLENAIERYTAEHEGLTPAHATDGSIDADIQRFIDRLTKRTTQAGAIDVSGDFPPYLAGWKSNPFTPCAAVRIDGDESPSDCSWRFDTAKRLLRPDHSTVLDAEEHAMHW